MARRLFALLIASALILAACGDDDTTADGDLTVPDVVGSTADFASGALESVGLVPDVIEQESDAPEGTVFEQVPAAGSAAAEGDTVVVKVSTGPATDDTTTTTDGDTTTTSAGETTTTTSSGTSTTAGATTTTTTAATTTTTTAATTTTEQVGLTEQQCEDHPYYEPRSDPNCSKADYRLEVNDTTSPRVWQCMSQGDGVYYNQDQPGNLACDQDRNAPNLYFTNNPPAPPYPDYDPTIGTVDTFIECSWKDAQYILDNYDHLSQGNQTLSGGFQWLVSNDNEVCAGR